METANQGLRRVFAGTWLAYAGFYLCRKNFSVLMPLLSQDLHFSKDDLAQLVFCYSLAYACGQFLSGTFADRFGAKPVVAAGMLLSVICSTSMAAASALWIFAALQLLNGFAQSAGWPGLVKITGAWFHPARRGILMAWWTTNYVAGGFLATIIATWFATGPLAPVWGWKAGAAGPAVLLLLAAAVFVVMVKSRPDAHPVHHPAAHAWKEVLASPALWSIATAYFCLKLARYTLLFWLPLYMVERLNYSAAQAGYMSSAYELFGFLGVPFAGYISDRLMGGRRFPVGAAMLFGLAIACWVFPQFSGLGPAANLAAIGLVGVLTYGPDSLMGGAATQEAASPAAMATAAGFINGVGSTGQLLSPLLVAVAVRWVGWDGLFGIFGAFAVVGGAALTLRWNTAAYSPQARLANV